MLIFISFYNKSSLMRLSVVYRDTIDVDSIRRIVDLGVHEIMIDATRGLGAIREAASITDKIGVPLNVLMDSSCFGASHLIPGGYETYHGYLERLEMMGVGAVTLTEAYLIDMVKNEFTMDVVASNILSVTTIAKARYLEGLGVDRIVLDPDINHDLELLSRIKETVSCDLILLVNEGCIKGCPFKNAHNNLISHLEGAKPVPKIESDYYSTWCISKKRNNPILIHDSGWIKPEDIEKYIDIGFDNFMIGAYRGRCPLNWTLSVVEAYRSRRFEGDPVNILTTPLEGRDA
ncbi:MAG: protease [Candidatus Syntrophoarchaeum sp. WYZ-LMO15]|nr:MAG: protease [Candidatus Syntrophoarchaeum sp. WYZ-LMO15]